MFRVCVCPEEVREYQSINWAPYSCLHTACTALLFVAVNSSFMRLIIIRVAVAVALLPAVNAPSLSSLDALCHPPRELRGIKRGKLLDRETATRGRPLIGWTLLHSIGQLDGPLRSVYHHRYEYEAILENGE